MVNCGLLVLWPNYWYRGVKRTVWYLAVIFVKLQSTDVQQYLGRNCCSARAIKTISFVIIFLWGPLPLYRNVYIVLLCKKWQGWGGGTPGSDFATLLHEVILIIKSCRTMLFLGVVQRGFVNFPPE